MRYGQTTGFEEDICLKTGKLYQTTMSQTCLFGFVPNGSMLMLDKGSVVMCIGLLSDFATADEIIFDYKVTQAYYVLLYKDRRCMVPVINQVANLKLFMEVKSCHV